MSNYYKIKRQDGLNHAVDSPAVVTQDGTKIWYQYGVKHRLDGPAVEHPDGTKEWWVAGYRHRKKGFAVEYPDGTGLVFRSGRAALYESMSGVSDLKDWLRRNPPSWATRK